MANSSIISTIKDKVIREIIDDEALFHAINSPTITDFNDSDLLINRHLFRYNQNPDTIDKVMTIITMQAHTQKISRYNSTDIWTRPVLEIFIYSHESHMTVNNIPKITADRNDYISQLLDDKFNGRTELGTDHDPKKLRLMGILDLVDNLEDTFSKDYLYRKMTFITKDLNNSLCEGR